MRATLTNEQEHLAEIAADMGADGLAIARRLVNGLDLPVEPTASLFSGFAGLGIPESHGGAGGGLVDVVILVEGLARTVVPTPWVTHIAATQIALGAGLPLDAAASGEVRLVAAAAPRPVRAGDVVVGETTTGTARATLDGVGAEHLVVVDHHGRAAPARVVSEVARPALDLTRPVADLVVHGDEPGRDVGDGLHRAAVVAAADLCGVGHGALHHAAAYAAERQQFGQPIGKFQGVAHQLAEALAYIDAAWALTVYAAWALDADAPDRRHVAHAAKARAGEAAVHAAERALQVHGGIGMTWEAQPHVFLKRALASDAWMGGRSAHRRALGRSILSRAT